MKNGHSALGEKSHLTTTWYIQPIGTYTNNHLRQSAEQFDIELEGPLLCTDGVSRTMFRTPFEIVKALQESKHSDDRLRFEVYAKKGGLKHSRPHHIPRQVYAKSTKRKVYSLPPIQTADKFFGTKATHS